MDLAEFLLARIAEDEAAAEATFGLDIRADSGFDLDYVPSEVPPPNLREIRRQSTARPWATLTFTAHPDPGRVLAECQVKRGVVALYRMAVQHKGEESSKMTRLFAEQSCEDLFDVLRLLALPYADHPDYRAEWKV